MSRRLFVAAWLTEEAREEAASVLSRLKEADADVKWIPAGNLHITLKFLGDVDASRIADLEECLASAFSKAKAFPTRLEGVGTFPSRGNARVVWIGLGEGAKGVAALASRAESALLAGGFLGAIDSRPFRAHVTLGRPKSPRGVGRLQDLLEEMSFAARTHPLEEVRLVESHLSPRGATYQAVARFPLGGE